MNVVQYRSRRRFNGLGALSVPDAESALFDAQGKLDNLTKINDKVAFSPDPLTIADIPQFMRNMCPFDILSIRAETVRLAGEKIDREDLRAIIADEGAFIGRRVAAWFLMRVVLRPGWPWQNVATNIGMPSLVNKKPYYGFQFIKASETENNENDSTENLAAWAVIPIDWVQKTKDYTKIHGKQLKWTIRWLNRVCPKLRQDIIDATRDVGLAQANLDAAKAAAEAAAAKDEAEKRITASQNAFKDESGGWSTKRILLIGGIALGGLAVVLYMTKKKV
jgi:hypothetical protein